MCFFKIFNLSNFFKRVLKNDKFFHHNNDDYENDDFQ